MNLISPQIENGHTDIANEIMEALAKIRIPGEARQVMDFIIRKTYGWHKKEDRIPLSQFVSGTGLTKITICKALKKLISMNLIITQKGNDYITSYCFNKHYNTWKPLPKKVTLPKKVKGITQKGNKSLPILVHSNETTKETYSKETYFLEFYNLYPLHKKKPEALKAWKKYAISEEMALTIIAGLRKHLEFLTHEKERGFCPYPASWLNANSWEDEVIDFRRDAEKNPPRPGQRSESERTIYPVDTVVNNDEPSEE